MIIRVSSAETDLNRRVVRVFVSSTFRGMYPDREVLNKYAFPELRKRCAQRNLEFVPVDLRWGITQAQIDQHKLISRCLSEIDLCRPYFLGMLGQYYGTEIDAFGPAELMEYPWIEQYKGCSVTELEIVHGVLRDHGTNDTALFFFRDEQHLKTLPKEEREKWRSTGFSATKLNDLKTRIRSAQMSVTQYKNPQDLCAPAIEGLWKIIDETHPANKVSGDEIAQENQDRFAHLLTRVYVGSSALFERLNNHVLGVSNPLIIEGEAGSGKSSLVANWAISRRKERPNELIVSYHVEANPTTSDITFVLTYLMRQIIHKTGIPFPIPQMEHEIIPAFRDLLFVIPEQIRLILIIDGVDRLEFGRNQSIRICLPVEIPRNIKLILTTRPGGIDNPLKEFPHQQVMSIPGLLPIERLTLTRKFLERHGKTLTKLQENRIVATNQTQSPLFLRILLDEMKIFGVYERLDETLDNYLQAQSIDSLYRLVLKRWEQDYEQEQHGLVKDTMSCLWASKYGLPENELRILLGDHENPIAAYYWSPFMLVVKEALLELAGVLHFSNSYIRRAVEQQYIKPGVETTTRQKIIRFMQKWPSVGFTLAISDQKLRATVLRAVEWYSELETRHSQELAWQYFNCHDWTNLSTLLGDLESLHKLGSSSLSDAQFYWQELEQNGVSMTIVYRDILTHSDGEEPPYLQLLASLLSAMGYSSQAQQLYDYLIKHHRNQGDWFELGNCLIRQAFLHKERNELNEAIDIYRQAEQIFKENDNPHGLGTAIHDQGVILCNQGKLRPAVQSFTQAKRIFQKHRLLNELAMALNSLCVAFLQQHNVNEALIHLTYAENLHKRLGPSVHYGQTLMNLALASYFRGESDQALSLLDQAEEQFRLANNQKGLEKCECNRDIVKANKSWFRKLLRNFRHR